MDRANVFRRLGVAAALGGCVGCAGTLEDPSRFDTDAGGDAVTVGPDSGCPDVPNDIFAMICGTAGFFAKNR